MYGYSTEMIEKALAETERIESLLRDHEEPFFDVAAGWLQALRADASGSGRSNV
jgi:hypothetical protein